MSGSGNDFVIIDNRDRKVGDDEKREFVKKVCAPKVSVGADGVIFVEDSDKADFRWDFYNADGSSAEMCGNGGRCVARYAYERKIAPQSMTFETVAGTIGATVNGANVKVKLTDPFDLKEQMNVELDGATLALGSVNTGVPHAVVFSDNVDNEDIRKKGSGIRYHDAFAPAGTNVNLIEKTGDGLKIRTYERGVEDETLACGTGTVASALIANCRGLIESPVEVLTRGGETLKVYFQRDNGSYNEIYLEGLTKTTFEGTLVEL